MNREILFKAKRKDNGEWVYGNINYLYDGIFILETCYCGNIEAPNYNGLAMGCGLEDNNITDSYAAMEYGWHEAIERQGELLPCFVEVIPKTVCQFTGLLDKNGNKIWEGDILRESPQTEWDKKSYKAFEVFWHDNDCCDRHIGWQFNRLHFHGNLCGGYTFETFKPEYVSKMIIIGNIFDNKELLNN